MYNFLASLYKKKDWAFMNYGYTDSTIHESLKLSNEDEVDRYCIQLYYHVLNSIDLSNCDVLEVGCGRGGGSSYIMRNFKPKKIVGVDYSSKAVALCRRFHQIQGLSFQYGDAEALPFASNSFDVVVNIESSHCYASMDRFLAQVKRVLRPGGYFLFADFRSQEQAGVLEAQLQASGLELIGKQDITSNVLAALDMDHDHRVGQIRRGSPRIIAGLVQEFAGIKDTRIYRNFAERENIYLSFVLRKNSHNQP